MNTVITTKRTQNKTNDVSLVGDHAVLKSNSPKCGVITTAIEIDDIAAMDSMGVWYARWNTNVPNFYIRENVKQPNGKKSTIDLQNFLMQPPPVLGQTISTEIR